MVNVLFEEDQKKVNDACELHAMGSYEIGEVARLSAVLYDYGIDVVRILDYEIKRRGLTIDEATRLKERSLVNGEINE